MKTYRITISAGTSTATMEVEAADLIEACNIARRHQPAHPMPAMARVEHADNIEPYAVAESRSAGTPFFWAADGSLVA